MSKKYLEDDDYDWDDDCEWDERYDEFDDSDDGEDEEEDERPARTKSSSSRSRRAVEETAVSSARVTVKSARTGAGSPASGKTGTKNSSSVRTGTKSSSSTKTGTKNGTSKKTGAGSSSTAGKGTSGKKVSARKKKRRRNMIVICILEVLLLAVICGGLFVMSKLDKIQKTPGGNVNFGPGGDAEYNELPSGVIASMENYTTYAVFGLDKRNMEQLDDGQSDVIIIASVNNQTGEINMVSVYRDTYLQIDKDGTMGKINAAYNRGGALNAIEALNTNLDLRIDHYVTVNWYAVAKTIDLMGGVDMEISEEVFYAKEPQWGGTWLNSYIEQTAREIGMEVTYPEGPGYQTLTGLQAVALCRIRQIGMDYARTATQRQVISQMFEKAKKANIATLIKIADSVFPNIQTDVQYTEMAGLLQGIGKYYLDESAGFPSQRGDKMMDYPWLESVIPKDLLTNVAELHKILYGNEEYVPSDTVINISERISLETGLYAD